MSAATIRRRRDPNWLEVVVAVSAFATFSTALLYILALAGR